ncbi:MAG: hypothetical protein V4444_04715 [Pseudomonadota bacterium]
MGFEAPKANPASRDTDHDAFGEEIVEHPRSAHPSGLTPVESPVHGQQAQIADRWAGADQGDDEVDEDYDDTAEVYEPDSEPDQVDDEAPEPIAQTPLVAVKKQALVFTDAPVEDLVEPAPEAPVVKIEQPVAATALRRSTKQRSAPGLKDKAAFTLRLDQARHLKLRLACAVHGRSAQMIVTDALDQLLAAMPELDAMAEKANRKGS